MDMNFEAQIKLAEWEARLKGQEHSKLRIGVEVMKYQRKINIYETSLADLEKEIIKSIAEIKKLKGGE